MPLDCALSCTTHLSPQELELWGSGWEEDGDRGAAELAGSGPCRLHRLSIELSRVVLDCGCMPALRRASLWAQEVAGAGTLGAAAGLRHLCIGSDQAGGFGRTFECALDKQWVEEALGALPPGLGVLELQGTFMSPKVGWGSCHAERQGRCAPSLHAAAQPNAQRRPRSCRCAGGGRRQRPARRGRAVAVAAV